MLHCKFIDNILSHLTFTDRHTETHICNSNRQGAGQSRENREPEKGLHKRLQYFGLSFVSLLGERELFLNLAETLSSDLIRIRAKTESHSMNPNYQILISFHSVKLTRKLSNRYKNNKINKLR